MSDRLSDGQLRALQATARRIADLEAENARLRAELDEARSGVKAGGAGAALEKPARVAELKRKYESEGE